MLRGDVALAIVEGLVLAVDADVVGAELAAVIVDACRCQRECLCGIHLALVGQGPAGRHVDRIGTGGQRSPVGKAGGLHGHRSIGGQGAVVADALCSLDAQALTGIDAAAVGETADLQVHGLRGFHASAVAGAGAAADVQRTLRRTHGTAVVHVGSVDAGIGIGLQRAAVAERTATECR